MNVLEVKTTISFEIIDENFDKYRGIVLPGGTRSGKTISVLQWLIVYCLKNTGKEIVICRDTLTNLKRTTLKDFQALCYGFGGYTPMAKDMILNKSEMFAVINGNTISFIGLLDDPMRVYGMRSDVFYINEAIATYKHTFNQLNQRCEDGWILDCNPSEPNSWVYMLNLRPDVLEFRTTYKDNPFLPANVIREIESYEPTEENEKNGTADPRMWSIYGQGKVHIGQEVIIPKWETFEDEPEGYDHVFYGLDWGWNDPLAVIKLVIDGNNLYLKEVIYGSEIEEEEYIDVLKREELLVEQKCYLVCDNTEEKSMRSLRKHGIPAIKAKKPKGSIMNGIKLIRRFNIFIHVDSVNLQREANNYKYKVDTKTDTILDVPIDKHNHCWDAIRYPLFRFIS